MVKPWLQRRNYEICLDLIWAYFSLVLKPFWSFFDQNVLTREKKGGKFLFFDNLYE